MQELALEMCNQKFDWGIANNNCQVNYYYNPSENLTIIQAGQIKNYPAMPNTDGYNLLATGSGQFIVPTWQLNIARAKESAGNDFRISTCGSTTSTRAPGGWAYAPKVVCTH